VADQEKILSEAISGNLMTASERLQLENAIVDRGRQQLKLEYRFALLRSQLSAAIGAREPLQRECKP
jgi:hypothetical protein